MSLCWQWLHENKFTTNFSKFTYADGYISLCLHYVQIIYVFDDPVQGVSFLNNPTSCYNVYS